MSKAREKCTVRGLHLKQSNEKTIDLQIDEPLKCELCNTRIAKIQCKICGKFVCAECYEVYTSKPRKCCGASETGGKITMTAEPKVCEFAKKADFMTLGRLCEISHPSDIFCGCWNNPKDFTRCSEHLNYVNEQRERELLEAT